MAFAKLQSYQERSRISPLSLPVHSMATRSVSRVTRTRPSAAISCRVKPPGTARTLRAFPDRSTAQRLLLVPLSGAAVNQISSPRGDQAKPASDSQPDDKVFFFPPRSITQTEPRSSQVAG